MQRGSLAVWCDTIGPQVAGLEPCLDLHFNIWLDLPDQAPAVLDIGFYIQESRQIEQLNLFVPAKLSLDEVQDLSEILRDNRTLSAVFNSTLFVGDEQTKRFAVKDPIEQVRFYVARIVPEDDLALENLGAEGSILKFTRKMFSNIIQ